MPVTAVTRQDGALPLAHNKLLDGVALLAHPRRHTIRLDGGRLHRVKLLSRYDELEAAVIAHRGGTGGMFGHQLPFWIDAMVLLSQIDRAVSQMHPAPRSWPGWTIARLRALEGRKWRPQDCDRINDYASQLASFSKRADTLFAPRPISLPNPCPECAVAVVYRDADGEMVRGAALKIDEMGASCGNCGANWPLEHLPMLGRLLGYAGGGL